MKSIDATRTDLDVCRGVIDLGKGALDEITVDSPARERKIAYIKKHLDYAVMLVSQIESYSFDKCFWSGGNYHAITELEIFCVIFT